MSDLPEPEIRPGDEVDPPGGPWKSWRSIYTTLAIWGVVCILFLIWITSTLNIDVGEASMDAGPAAMDVDVPVSTAATETVP